MQAATLEELRSWPVGRPLAMVPPMQRITLRVILGAVLGLPSGPELERFERLVARVLAAGRMRYGLALVPLVPRRLVQNSRWMPFFRQLRAFDQALFPFINRQRGMSAADRGENV